MLGLLFPRSSKSMNLKALGSSSQQEVPSNFRSSFKMSSQSSCSATPPASSRRPRSISQAHAWTDEETRKFLSLMKGEGDALGYFGKIKTKRMERIAAMREIADTLNEALGTSLTASQVDNKWKSLLSRYRMVEDQNNQSGNCCRPIFRL